MRLRALCPRPDVRVASGDCWSPKLRLRTIRLGRYLSASSVFITLIVSAICAAVTLSVVAGSWYFCATVGGSDMDTSGSVVTGGTDCGQAAGAAQASTAATNTRVPCLMPEFAPRALRPVFLTWLPRNLCRTKAAGNAAAYSAHGMRPASSDQGSAGGPRGAAEGWVKDAAPEVPAMAAASSVTTRS